MKHWRKKKLLKNLRDLYLDNWKDAASYAEQSRTIRCLEVVGANLRRQYEEEDRQPSGQLSIF